MINIALFASGSGSNVENIVKYFEGNSNVNFTKVYCNKPEAYVLERAKNLNLSSRVFTREEFNSEVIVNELLAEKTDLVILAGFLWKIPSELVKAFPNKIVNIHPALLPKFGGKGMYGMNVHKAVVEANEKESGITIHYVNEHYDEGPAIFQATTVLTAQDTPETVAEKVHQLEYEHFPKVIELIVNQLVENK